MGVSWKPTPGMHVEVRLEYPIPAGSVQHTCWKEGVVTAVQDSGLVAEVELTWVGVLPNA